MSQNREPIPFLTLSSVAAVLIAISQPTLGADFPELQQQVDSTRIPFGKGTCATYRTGVWLAQGGVVIEIQKPSNCRFESLQLVVDGKRYPLAAADSSFYHGKRSNAYWEVKVYEWYRSDAGKLFFRTELPIDPSKIQGILEPGCQSKDCLNEDAALPAR